MADEIIIEPDHIQPDIPEPFEIVQPPSLFGSRLGSHLGYGRVPQYIDNPIRAVRWIVSRHDDPDLQSMTVRTWTIGPILCAGMAVESAKGLFQDKELVVPMVVIQFIILGAARLMEMLPNKILRVPLMKRELSLNPCEFNYKENTLISLFAYIGRIRPGMLQTISATRIKFGEEVFFSSALLTVLSSYLLSFSLVGIFLSWVPSPEMWWPSKLLDVVFFRTWHKKLDDGSRGAMTNKKFFTIVFFVAILFQIPGFFYPSVATISFLFWLWPKSIIAQQLGSGINGLGALSFSSGWPSVSDFIEDPLATPRHVIYNVMAGLQWLILGLSLGLRETTTIHREPNLGSSVDSYEVRRSRPPMHDRKDLDHWSNPVRMNGDCKRQGIISGQRVGCPDGCYTVHNFGGCQIDGDASEQNSSGPLIKRELSLNPCEFNYTEHTLISLFRPDMLQTISATRIKFVEQVFFTSALLRKGGENLLGVSFPPGVYLL